MQASARLLLAVGAVLGGGGVALAAVAAHAVQTPALGNAAIMAVIHAAACAALALSSHAMGSAARTAALLRLSGWVIALGALLFTGDIALRELAGYRLFPMAAPTGGSLMILGWLSLLVPAALARRA